VIIALGGTAMEGLFGEPCAITRVRGRKRLYNGFPVMPTFHPAYVLRNADEITLGKIWMDICRAMEIAGYDLKARWDWRPKIPA
jgi:DNA polymerase